jgi:predicted transcriptional regulator
MQVMDIEKKHKQLLEAQSQRHPTLTMSEMGDVLGSESSGYISWLLEKLVRLGMAEKIQRGGKHVYRIVDSYKHNPESHE